MSQLVTFRVGRSRYALPVDVVSEVIESPTIEVTPCSRENMIGVSRVRGRWIPVVVLPGQCDDDERSEDEGAEGARAGAGAVLVVLGWARARLGLRVEGFGEVLDSSASAGLERSADGLLEIGSELIRYVDPASLLTSNAQVLGDGGGGQLMAENWAQTEQMKIVVFRIGEEEFGVDVMKVFEVLQRPAVRTVPKAPDFVEGIAEVRTAVVPVIDMRKRFNVPHGDASAPERLLVVEVGEHRIGLVVDAVPGVVKLESDSISPPPEYFKGLAARYMGGIARKLERLIILLNLEEILSSTEKIELDAVVAELEPSKPAKGGGKRAKRGRGARRGDGRKKKEDG
ncbi:MAG: chemotaxis protein CheW [Gemmatimonadota bacterium]